MRLQCLNWRELMNFDHKFFSIMAIPTTRTREKGLITIDEETCTGCGLCVSVCKDFSLTLKNGKAVLSGQSIFGCTGCGHCMAICPEGAISIRGREISPEDLFDLPPRSGTAGYEQLLALLQRRRSVREFTPDPVESDLREKIIRAAQTAPMGLPPSDVNLLVLENREQVHAFTGDFISYLKGLRWMTSGWFLALMRPFWGREMDELFREFVRPCMTTYLEHWKKDMNVITYDAPLSMYFYGSPYCDPADPLIAATYAMIAGESLGLGTCMLGAIHPLIQSGRQARKFREKQGIRFTSREGVFVIFGHPAVNYQKGIHRSFASVTRYN